MSALNINKSDPNNLLSALPSIGGIVVKDVPFARDTTLDTNTYYAVYIRVGVGAPTNSGVLVIEDHEGRPIIFTGVLSGELIPVAKALRVLTSAPIPASKGGGTATTTCTDMQWLGGAY